jgi:peptidoglycan hydrolase CwlO-like protein
LSVEKCVGKFDEIKNIITSLTSRVVSTEKDIKESQRQITEVESGIQGVGNLFDNLKTVVEYRTSQMMNVLLAVTL